MMAPHWAAVVVVAVSYFGWRRKKLSFSGSLCACVLGLYVGLNSPLLLTGLLTVYFFGNFVTKFGANKKCRLLTDYKPSGERGLRQVLGAGGCTLLATLLRSEALGMGGLACALGDTFASELGILSSMRPRNIINPMRQVNHGYDGGITVCGLLASCVGGGLIGLVYVCIGRYPLKLFWDMTMCGFFGSLVDSLLGSLFQSRDQNNTEFGTLSNSTVNIISSIITGILYHQSRVW